MKSYLISGLAGVALLFSNIVLAEGMGPPKGGNPGQFNEQKSRMLQNLNERKTALDQAISCVHAAQQIQALQQCRQSLHSNMEQHRPQGIAQHQEGLQNKTVQ